MTLTTRNSGGKQIVMSQAEFAEYVEQVFRYHNQVMSDLIDVAEDRGQQNFDEEQALSVAEARMIEVCQPLNEVVSEALSGRSVGLTTEMQLADTVPACEEASHAVEDLLP